MEKVEAKHVQPNRRTKYLLVGLVAVIILLSFNSYKSYQTRQDLVRRKNFLILRLRSYKEEQDKLNLEKSALISNHKRMLTEKEQELVQTSNQIRSLTNANQDNVGKLTQLKQTASESRESLVSLKQEHEAASVQLTIMKENLQKALNSCKSTTEETRVLKENVSQKESGLSQCLQENQATQYKLQEANKRLDELMRQSQTNNNQRPQANAGGQGPGTLTTQPETSQGNLRAQTGNANSPRDTAERTVATGITSPGTQTAEPQGSSIATTGIQQSHANNLSHLGDLVNRLGEENRPKTVHVGEAGTGYIQTDKRDGQTSVNQFNASQTETARPFGNTSSQIATKPGSVGNPGQPLDLGGIKRNVVDPAQPLNSERVGNGNLNQQGDGNKLVRETLIGQNEEDEDLPDDEDET